IGREPAVCLADWRTGAGQSAMESAGPFSLVLAADVLYEREDITPLLDLVARILLPGGTFLLAEPGRATSAQFLSDARDAGWTGPTVEITRDWPARAGQARVRIHSLRRGTFPADQSLSAEPRPD
ncbi:MAG TPA: hypothetical protein VGW38_04735, partial [Chloroflexota bacterium]|nr:hypothetical protein [Chloroflexota bacterium]